MYSHPLDWLLVRELHREWVRRAERSRQARQQAAIRPQAAISWIRIKEVIARWWKVFLAAETPGEDRLPACCRSSSSGERQCAEPGAAVRAKFTSLECAR